MYNSYRKGVVGMMRTTAWMLIVEVAMAALLLAGCGGTDTPVTGPGMLFVTVNDNGGPEAVAIFEMASARNGDTTPDRYLEGAQTGFQELGVCANNVVSQTDDLYLGDVAADAIWIFSPVTSVDGNTAPTRTLQGANVPLDDLWGIAVDTTRDILYVGDPDTSKIYVWDDAATINGNVTPDRTIEMGTGCRDIAVDQTNDRLYVCAASGDEIWILNNASTQDGTVVIGRNINGATTQLDNAHGIELDLSRDRLYVANRNTNAILAFDNVDTIDGNVAPLNVISGAATGLDAPIDITLDRQRDHIYQVNDVARDDAVRVWHNASGADGNLPPNRVISNSAGLLDRSRALSFISQ